MISLYLPCFILPTRENVNMETIIQIKVNFTAKEGWFSRVEEKVARVEK